DQIERTLGKGVRADVVTDHLDVRGIDGTEEVELQVGRGHLPIRSDAIGEPASDRTPTATDLQAARVGRELKPLDAPLGQRIEPLLQELQPPRLIGGRMRECVLRGVHEQDPRPITPYRPARTVPASGDPQGDVVAGTSPIDAAGHLPLPRRRLGGWLRGPRFSITTVLTTGPSPRVCTRRFAAQPSVRTSARTAGSRSMSSTASSPGSTLDPARACWTSAAGRAVPLCTSRNGRAAT